MRLYLIRHGKSVHNDSNQYQPPESPLGHEGIEQADLLAHRLVGEKLDRLISSPYMRALQTAAAISRRINLPVEKLDLVHETDRPTELVELDRDNPKVKMIRQLLDHNINNPDFHYSDEENFFDVQKRIEAFFSYVGGLDDKRVAVVTHNTFLKQMLGSILIGDALTPDLYLRMYHSITPKENTGITVLDRKAGKWLLTSWNDYGHLGL